VSSGLGFYVGLGFKKPFLKKKYQTKRERKCKENRQDTKSPLVHHHCHDALTILGVVGRSFYI
jgi:hypothetical protein